MNKKRKLNIAKVRAAILLVLALIIFAICLCINNNKEQYKELKTTIRHYM